MLRQPSFVQVFPSGIPFRGPVLIRLVYPQSSSFLLLVNLLFVLLLVYVSTFTQTARFNVSTFTQTALRECFHFHPGKLPRITGTCG